MAEERADRPDTLAERVARLEEQAQKAGYAIGAIGDDTEGHEVRIKRLEHETGLVSEPERSTDGG